MRHYIRRDTCRLCGSRDLEIIIPMRPLPIASPNVGYIDPESSFDTAPADVYQCQGCRLIQLCHIIDPELQYSAFQYTTTVSVGLPEHFIGLADEIAADYMSRESGFLLEIGSNDGTFLRLMQTRGHRVLGIDPAVKIAEQASESGVPTLARFFDPDLAREIRHQHGCADVIVSCNTIANVDQMDDLMTGIRELSHENTIFVIETQYGMDVLEKTLLDVIYHEHLSYYTLAPLKAFFSRHGFRMVDAKPISPKGGSIRVVAAPADSRFRVSENCRRMLSREHEARHTDSALADGFNARVALVRDQIREKVASVRARGGVVAVFGASVGCASLLHQFDLCDCVDVVFDDNAFHDKMPGLSREVPIRNGDQISAVAPDLILFLAWRYTDTIMSRHGRLVPETCELYKVLPTFGPVARTASQP